MAGLVHELTTDNFDQLANSAEFFLVEVGGSGHKDKIIRALASHFSTEYPKKFTFGKLAPKKVTVNAWWAKRFPTALFRTPSGFYLFHRGKQTWRHSGRVPVDDDDTLRMAIDLVGIFVKPTVDDAPDAFTRKRINAIADSLEGHLKGLEAPKPAIGASANKSTDPYAVLGLTPSASNEEIRQAYKTKMANNHPDKVAHLDAAFKTLAETQVRDIQSAYETIKKERGLT